jgi:hypothetical protein
MMPWLLYELLPGVVFNEKIEGGYSGCQHYYGEQRPCMGI